MKLILFVCIVGCFSNLRAQDNIIANNSVFRASIDSSHADLFVLGEVHGTSFPLQQFEIIKYLYNNQGVREIGFESLKLEDKSINDFIRTGDRRYFKLHKKNYASKQKFELLECIYQFNKSKQDSDKIEIFCLDIFSHDFHRFLNLFGDKYGNLFFDKNIDLNKFYNKKYLRSKDQRVLEKEFFLYFDATNTLELEQIFASQISDVINDVQSYKVYAKFEKSDYNTIQYDEDRENYIYHNVLPKINKERPILVIVGSFHANKSRGYTQFNSFTSRLVKDSDFSIFSIATDAVVKKQIIPWFRDNYLPLVNKPRHYFTSKRGKSFVIFNSNYLSYSNHSEYVCDLYILFNGLKLRRKLL